MGGAFSAGGLVSGIDSNNIIRQIIAIERQPITRIQARIDRLEAQRNALRDLRTQILALRDALRDIRLGQVFQQFLATSSSESVLSARVSGDSPTQGTFQVEVLQLANPTTTTSSQVLGAAIDPNAALNASGIRTEVTAGTFTINGVQFNVDPATQSLNDIIGAINGSSAGVTATYDAVSDSLTLTNSTAGDTSIINLGASGDTSNFLTTVNLVGATQSSDVNNSTQVTSSRNLGAVDPLSVLNTESFRSGAVTAGTFFINGVSISVDPTIDTLSDVIQRINSSDARVTVSLDSNSDRLLVVSDTFGSRTINFASGSSNFLDVVNLTSATQTVGADSQFRVNGGAVQTANTNEVTTAIAGVTLTFLDTGTSTVTVADDHDAILEDVRGVIESFNTIIQTIRDITGVEGAIGNDITIRNIDNTLRSTVFQQVPGVGTFTSLLDIGISTGDAFDSTAPFQLELDEEEFLAALRDDPTNVSRLFTNSGESGVADLLFDFLDPLSSATGPLNDRIRANGGIDRQIEVFESQIERIERRVGQREERLRAQFAQLEQLINGFQVQNQFLSGLDNGLNLFRL